jgi:hypothetical protein
MYWQTMTTYLVASVLCVGGALGCTESRSGANSSGNDDAGAEADTMDDADPASDATADVADDDTSDAQVEDTFDAHDEDTADASAEDTSVEDTSGGGTIEIFLAGDLSEKTFDDGLSGQTPLEYEIALSKYHVQTSLDDPSPVVCFEHDQPVVADMLEDNRVGTCETATIPTDNYTHGRTKVDWVRLTVDGTLHYAGQSLPDEFTFFRAYSDTTYDGEDYAAGEGWVQYGGDSTNRTDLDYGEAVPTEPGVEAETIGGEFWFTFPYERPLPVDQNNQQSHWSRLHWEVYEGFRWEDRQSPNYTDGQWDVSATNPARTEQVSSYGVTGSYITTSVD